VSGQDPKTKLLGFGVFLLPLILVKGTAIWVGQPQGADASAGAAVTVDVGDIETFTPEWSFEQIATTHRVAELREVPFGESPLLHARKNTDIEPIETPDQPTTITPPDVSVRIILHSRRGGVALIDRKRYRAGDALGDGGWFIEEIHAVSRSVLIVHRESGEKATLYVPMPRSR